MSECDIQRKLSVFYHMTMHDIKGASNHEGFQRCYYCSEIREDAPLFSVNDIMEHIRSIHPECYEGGGGIGEIGGFST